MLRATALTLSMLALAACDRPTTTPDDARNIAACLLRVALEHSGAHERPGASAPLSPEQIAALIEIAEAAGKTAACLR